MAKKLQPNEEELVKAPSSSPSVSAAAVSEFLPEKIASVEKSKKNKKRSKKKKKKKKKAQTSTSAAVTSPTQKKNKNATRLNTEEKQTKQPPREAEDKEESPGGTHEQEKLFQTPPPSPAAAADPMSETETQKKKETKNKKRHTEEGRSSRDVEAKRVKTKEKTYFQRLWSDADEIVWLQKIIDFKSDPSKDREGFHGSVEKSSISFEFTLNPLFSKIRRLRQKFLAEEKNKVVSFSTPHDKTRFDMSKKICGSVAEGKDRKNVAMIHGGERDWFEKSFLFASVASCGLGEEEVKFGWSLVAAKRKKKLQEELRLVASEETRLLLHKMTLVRQATSAIAEATS